MKKIISLFQRNYDGDRLVRNEVVPGAEWVTNGEGVATRKFDGTCCLVRGGKLYRRYEVQPRKQPPPDFEAANDVDSQTGKQQGWVPVGDGPDDQWHREAFGSGEVCIVGIDGMEYASLSWTDGWVWGPLTDGTYELCGPKIQNNPEGLGRHELIRHGCVILTDCPRDYEGLKQYLTYRAPTIEGVVWHHPDGRMVKIKRKDFFKR